VSCISITRHSSWTFIYRLAVALQSDAYAYRLHFMMDVLRSDDRGRLQNRWTSELQIAITFGIVLSCENVPSGNPATMYILQCFADQLILPRRCQAQSMVIAPPLKKSQMRGCGIRGSFQTSFLPSESNTLVCLLLEIQTAKRYSSVYEVMVIHLRRIVNLSIQGQ
jgi:hypothetical protein